MFCCCVSNQSKRYKLFQPIQALQIFPTNPSATNYSTRLCFPEYFIIWKLKKWKSIFLHQREYRFCRVAEQMLVLVQLKLELPYFDLLTTIWILVWGSVSCQTLKRAVIVLKYAWVYLTKPVEHPPMYLSCSKIKK